MGEYFRTKLKSLAYTPQLQIAQYDSNYQQLQARGENFVIKRPQRAKKANFLELIELFGEYFRIKTNFIRRVAVKWGG